MGTTDTIIANLPRVFVRWHLGEYRIDVDNADPSHLPRVTCYRRDFLDAMSVARGFAETLHSDIALMDMGDIHWRRVHGEYTP